MNIKQTKRSKDKEVFWWTLNKQRDQEIKKSSEEHLTNKEIKRLRSLLRNIKQTQRSRYKEVF